MGARLSAGVPSGPPAGYAATSDPARGGGERRWSPSPADRSVPAGLSSSLTVGNVPVASPRRQAPPPPPQATARPGPAPSHLPRLTTATTQTSVTNAGPSRSSNITTGFSAAREVSGEASTVPGGGTVLSASDSREPINGLVETIQTLQLAARFALLTGIELSICFIDYFVVFSEFSTRN